MPPMPDISLILELLRDFALPAAGGATLTFALFLTMGRWAATIGSAAAIIVGFAWANFNFESLQWENTTRLIPWIPNERYSWHHLPQAALVLVAAGLVSRWLGLLTAQFVSERGWWVPSLIVWLPRWIAILVVGSWVVPAPWAQDSPWIKPALGMVMLFSWIALDGAARVGANGQAALSLAGAFFAASAVIIYAHSSLFMDIAVAMGFAMLGIAVVARVGKVDARGAIPAGIGFLPALMLNARFYLSENLVPLAAFWLVGLAPLALLPFSIPRIARQNRWLLGIARLVLLLIPLVIAVALAMHFEELPPSDEK